MTTPTILSRINKNYGSLLLSITALHLISLPSNLEWLKARPLLGKYCYYNILKAHYLTKGASDCVGNVVRCALHLVMSLKHY